MSIPELTPDAETNREARVSKMAIILAGSALALTCITSGSVLASSFNADTQAQNPCYGSQNIEVKQGQQVKEVATGLSTELDGTITDISAALQFMNSSSKTEPSSTDRTIMVFSDNGIVSAPTSCTP